ncbi:15977_t:CDS:2 [Funneliformis geosporum]|nr:15977_t:CDS:2 [Funneliformis geosporum]
MPPKGKIIQNQVLPPNTRNQKRKNDDNLIPETPAKKTKAPTKRGPKKKKKKPTINNDNGNNEIQKTAPANHQKRTKTLNDENPSVSFNYNYHLINTPRSTTLHLTIPRSTTTCLTDTRSTNTHPNNTCFDDTSFNDDVVRSNALIYFIQTHH